MIFYGLNYCNAYFEHLSLKGACESSIYVGYLWKLSVFRDHYFCTLVSYLHSQLRLIFLPIGKSVRLSSLFCLFNFILFYKSIFFMKIFFMKIFFMKILCKVDLNLKFYTENLITLSGIYIKSSSFMLCCCSVVWLFKLRLEKLGGLALLETPSTYWRSCEV